MPDLFHSLRLLQYVWTHIDWNEWAIQKRNIQKRILIIFRKSNVSKRIQVENALHMYTHAQSHIRYYLMFSISMIIFLMLLFFSLFSRLSCAIGEVNEYVHVVNINIISFCCWWANRNDPCSTCAFEYRHGKVWRRATIIQTATERFWTDR